MSTKPRVTDTVVTPTDFQIDPQYVWLKEGNLVSTAVDARSTGETWKLKPGLVLGRITTGGKLRECLHASSDGSQVAVGILADAVNMKGDTGVVADQPCVMLIHGRVVSASCATVDSYAIAALPLISFE